MAAQLKTLPRMVADGRCYVVSDEAGMLLGRRPMSAARAFAPSG
ncbi:MULTISPECIES: hypothetical protein [unclassified Streptomyces]